MTDRTMVAIGFGGRMEEYCANPS